MRKSVFISIFIVLTLAFTGCVKDVVNIKKIESKTSVVSTYVREVEKEEAPSVETLNQSFEVLSITKDIEQRISGISWRQGSPVSLDDLSYVKVAYWGFDDKEHIGELIVNKAVAQDIKDIFEELYENKFPIEKIRLIDEYAADDSKSMENNNTSAFNFREVEGKPGKLSKHAYGLAIDINPVQNPYVYKQEISPASGKAYKNREDIKAGMILKDDVCYKAFISRGWIWGGDWKYEKDYQHFQKNIDIK